MYRNLRDWVLDFLRANPGKFFETRDIAFEVLDYAEDEGVSPYDVKAVRDCLRRLDAQGKVWRSPFIIAAWTIRLPGESGFEDAIARVADFATRDPDSELDALWAEKKAEQERLRSGGRERSMSASS